MAPQAEPMVRNAPAPSVFEKFQSILASQFAVQVFSKDSVVDINPAGTFSCLTGTIDLYNYTLRIILFGCFHRIWYQQLLPFGVCSSAEFAIGEGWQQRHTAQNDLQEPNA
jgi:hypothetical protein